MFVNSDALDATAWYDDLDQEEEDLKGDQEPKSWFASTIRRASLETG